MLLLTKLVLQQTRIFPLLISLMIYNLSFAQTESIQECGSTPTAKQIAYMDKHIRPLSQEYARFKTRSSTIYVPIKAHIIRDDNGILGLTLQELTSALNTMNNHYQSINIQFFLYEGIHYIDNNNYYAFQRGDEASIGATYDVDNVINIYFANTVANYSGKDICGYAHFPEDGIDRIVMSNICALNGSTLSHEMGHYFSLYHTHETYLGKELVNGSNCSDAGDQICDTPADPGLSSNVVDQHCTYTGTATDKNGEAYTPNADNLMSYSLKPCRTKFTQGQYDRILAAMNTSRTYLLTTNTIPPAIDSFTPSQGHPGTLITIKGTGFSTTPADNIVMFSGVQATVQTSSDTLLTVSLPPNVQSGIITVSVNKQLSISKYSFLAMIDAFPYVESFEKKPLSWVQEFEDDFDWTYNKGNTLSADTGPSHASDGNIYMYMEASSPNYPGKFAYLNSPVFDLSGLEKPEFIFDYHMLGKNTGLLALDISTDNGNNWGIVWIKEKDQGDSWHTEAIDLSNYQSSQVKFRFLGITDSGFAGDMAIDHIRIKGSKHPHIQKFSPVNVFAGSTVTVTGERFGNTIHNNKVKFNGVVARVTKVTDNSLEVIVPKGTTSGRITLEVNGKITSSTESFVTIPTLSLDSFMPEAGMVGSKVLIKGANFNSITDEYSVKFNGLATTVTRVTESSLEVIVPHGATSGKIAIEANEQTVSSSKNFTVLSPLAITGFTPESGKAGTQVTITGTGFGFGSRITDNTVTLNGVRARITEATETHLSVIIPGGATSGKIAIEANEQTVSSSENFTVLSPLTITGFTPESGEVGSKVSITGTGFSSTVTDNKVMFNGIVAVITRAMENLLEVIIPEGATSGKITIETQGETVHSTQEFAVNTVTALTQEFSGIKFNLYPIPWEKILHIEVSGATSGTPVTIDLYNTQGQLASSVTQMLLNEHLHIPIQDIPGGVYTIKITINGKTISHRIVKK